VDIRPDWVPAIEWLGDTVGGSLLLFFKSAKHPVPDNKYTCMVLIDILWVNAMMYPVMGRGIENIFKPTGHFFDYLGMYPKLIKRVDGQYGEEGNRINAQHRDREENKERQHIMEPALPKCYGKVVVLTLVVYHMCTPQEIDLMT
jgi:hypothetical protein